MCRAPLYLLINHKRPILFTLLHVLATASDLFFWWYLQELQASRISPEGTGGLAMETLPSVSVTQTNSISEIRLKNHILHNFTACISEVCSTFAHNSSRFFPQS